jgi:serine/threonine protein phosphatase PrpC
MGGHAGGEEASRIAITGASGLSTETLEIQLSLTHLVLVDGYTEAKSAIVKIRQIHPNAHDMGTTLSR